MAKRRKEAINDESPEASALERDVYEKKESKTEDKEQERELTPEEVEEARATIEKSDVNDSLKLQATTQAQNLKLLDEKKKLQKLIAIVKSKGVIYAVLVAKKMDDPFVLDMLHDFLAQEGHYKPFLK